MVSALEHLGLSDAFDEVYGSSAGAINAAYFLAGQAALGTTIYYEDINTSRFISLLRPVWGRPIVDLDFLVNDVMVRRKPLDIDRVLASPAPLAVLATDVATETRVVLRGFPDSRRLLGAMRAGATMPVIAGGPFAYGGRTYLDASLSEPVPVAAAEEDGYTEVVALLTRGGAMRLHPSSFDRYFVGPQLRRISPGLAARYLNRARPYAALAAAIDSGVGPRGRARVLGIRAGGARISKLERGADVLRDAAARGYDAVMAAFT
jgi:predicted patatin/cPLA2 family phospholipase